MRFAAQFFIVGRELGAGVAVAKNQHMLVPVGGTIERGVRVVVDGRVWKAERKQFRVVDWPFLWRVEGGGG